jgi:hypothetical protein
MMHYFIESAITYIRVMVMVFNATFNNISVRASVAAEPLAIWVKANVKYSYVLEKIGPLEAEQNELKK